MNPAVAGCPKDLDPSELKELEFAPERPAAELPEAKIPPRERLGQLVEVTGAQRLQKHEPSPVATFNRRQIAVFRLDCTDARHRIPWKRIEGIPGNKLLELVPEGSPHDFAQ